MINNNFIFNKTSIDGLYEIETKRIEDDRGYFSETYKETIFKDVGLDYNFVQDNESFSKKGVLRGLHFQKLHPQAKLVRVVEGSVFDVAVDLRKDSTTYGKWVGVILSADKGNMLLIPRGFAHGFLVLSETAKFCYKCDDVFYPNDEGGIIWNDPDINIAWPIENVDTIILSEKDKKHPRLKEI